MTADASIDVFACWSFINTPVHVTASHIFVMESLADRLAFSKAACTEVRSRKTALMSAQLLSSSALMSDRLMPNWMHASMIASNVQDLAIPFTKCNGVARPHLAAAVASSLSFAVLLT